MRQLRIYIELTRLCDMCVTVMSVGVAAALMR